MTSDTTSIRELSGPDIWPGEWFVLKDVNVTGPISSDEAFRFPSVSETNEPVLISRKGFSQWYPMIDVAQLYKMSKLNKTRHLTDPKPTGKTIATPKPEKVDSIEQDDYIQTLKSIVASPPAPAHSPDDSAETLYAKYKNFLNLGEIRPLVAGSKNAPDHLTWFAWADALMLEIGRHRSSRHSYFSPTELNVPLFSHCSKAYRLGKAIRSMEEENGYRSTKPFYAAFLALLPQKSRTYLQAKANQHWKLHIQSLQKTNLPKA